MGCPHQTVPVVIAHLRVRIDELLLQRFQGIIIELKLEFESAIRHPPATL